MSSPTATADPAQSVFAVLAAFRYPHRTSAWRLRQALLRRGVQLRPRLPFWIHLCQATSLLDHQSPPHPTLLVPDWLALPRAEQLTQLLEAWQRAPASRDLRRMRRRLLHLLQQPNPEAMAAISRLGPTYIRELSGLQALGLCDDAGLTPLGWALLTGQTGGLLSPPPAPWTLNGSALLVPFPPDWSLLWELETYLQPATVGCYPLASEALARAAQQGAPDKCRQILEQGLGGTLPPVIAGQLLDRPTIRLLPGPILEFDDPTDLIRLRETPGLRRGLASLLSPRHVHLDPDGSRPILRRLQRRGLLNTAPLASCELPQPEREKASTDLGEADRAYLLSLTFLARDLAQDSAADLPDLDPPPGLIARLEAGLAAPLRAAASRRAQAALRRLSQPSNPHTSISADDSDAPPPSINLPSLISALQTAAAAGEAVDVLYHVPGRPAPEPRHLTPLLVEQRGPRFYVIAYCHTRRANRTFRLDRLQLNSPVP